MDIDLKPDDILSRYLTYSKHINSEKGVVNTSVFTEKHPKGFSVFKTTNLSEETIWKIANDHVVKPGSNQPLRGRCDLATKYYLMAKLDIKKSEPPPRHYNIFGMPVPSKLEEAENISLRQEMVAKSRLVLSPVNRE